MTNQPQFEDIHLRRDEFAEIYELLRLCLVHFSENPGNAAEGDELLEAAREALARTDDPRLQHDFTHGFIPLYKRLYAVKESDEPADIVHVSFT